MPLSHHSRAPFKLLLALFAAILMTNASAQTLTFKDLLDRTPRPAPAHKVTYGAHADQYAELWLPETSGALLPVVVLIHGGCWRADLPGPELVAFLSQAIAQNGVAVWSVTYRRVGTKAENFSPYPDTFLDVAAAADKLREIAPRYKLDLNRVITTGHSAGGHLALWLAARPKIASTSSLYSAAPLPVKATVGIAALADLQYAKSASAHACGADTVDLLINTKERKDAAYLDTSVTPLLPLGLPQTLISGVYDGIVAPAHALRYRERAKAKGETVTLLTLDDSGHFELIAPWTAPGARVVESIANSVKGLK
ncbi:MAG: alpha/beta hydrolase [Burkholderiales bacterium]|jgi:acetyl esterase/lipase|nr:alpha/beta hydrolase [Rhodocyclaceae bacterium]